MSKYKQTDITGEEYTRCDSITVANPLDRVPSITFQEERVLVLPDRSINTRAGHIFVPFDPEATVALRNPETDELTGGTITHGEIYAIMYSAYIQSALARDAAQHESPPESPPES